jgi:seryl-tRNA synthetase
MFKRLRENFKEGLYRLKWVAIVLAERLKIEIAVIRLLYQSDEMEKSREELLKSIGLRVYELKDNPEKNIMLDRNVLAALDEIKKIEKNIDELKKKVSEMSSARV